MSQTKLPFASLLKGRSYHVFDGAMGTMIYQKGVFINQSYDELCLKNPRLIKEIHREYLDAGAEIIETNSFGATRPHLKAYGLEDQVALVNRKAAEIAREAVAEHGQGYVAGSVGPLGMRLRPYGPVALTEARAYFKEAIQALFEGGVDLLILETFSDLSELLQAIRAAREVTDLPLIAQMTIQNDGKTLYGNAPEDIAKALDPHADVIGLNCSVGPATMLEAIEVMARVTHKPLSAQPNAGMPREIEGRKIYMSSPEYLAEYAKRLIQKGARFVGGCCGTTPEHIRQIANAVRALSPRQSGPLVLPTHEREERRLAPVPVEQRSKLAAKMMSGGWVTSVEILPPKGWDPEAMLEGVSAIKEAGVDAVNVPDGPRAQSRMGVIATSYLIEQRVGIEAVAHYACRDRNLLGMQSDLLGAAALGLRNLLVITGDPPKMGPFPAATAVFDVDSIGLTSMVNNFNHGLDLGRNPIGEPTPFFIGVGVNPCALDLENELRRLAQKIEAGAHYAVTQPVFDPRQLMTFLKRIEGFRIPVIAGIWPLASLRNAEFLSNEVAGVVIPSGIMERMRQAKTPEEAQLEGIWIAREMLDEVRGAINGVQVSAPLGKIPLALEVLR